MSEKIYDPAQDKDVPTPVRINSVLYYMDKEPAIKGLLGKTTVGVKKRTGEIVHFPVEVFNVAVKLHKEGKDALEVGKSEILMAARTVLGLGPVPSSAPTKASMATQAGTKVVRQTVHGILQLASELVSEMDGKNIKGEEIAKDINRLKEQLGFSGKTELTAVIPYTLMLSASQLIRLDADMGKSQSAFDAVVKKLQRVTTAEN
jgi:hypothetical protein